MIDEDFISFQCPHCGGSVDYLKEFAGTVQGCPGCGGNVVVPEADGQPGKPLPLPIQTPRLLLRRLHARDWKDLLEFLADPDVYYYEPGEPMDEARLCAWLEADQGRNFAAGQPLYLAVTRREDEKTVGVLRLQFEDAAHLVASVWVRVHPRFQRQGLAVEALQGLFKFCFEGIGLHRLVASCDSRNEAAVRMLEKAGMRREGEFLQDRLVDGKWADTCYYARLAREPAPAGE